MIFYTFMKYSNTLADLNRVLFYTAPASCSPTPYQISPGIQLLEIILDGVVYFEIDHVKHPCRRGTIFWHIAGDHTICETTRDEPYRCLVLRFNCLQDQRIAPHVSFWRSSDAALEEFVNTTYQVFSANQHDPEAVNLLSCSCASELLLHTKKLIPLHPAAPVPIEDDREILLLRSILNYIENNLAEDLSVNNLSNHLKIPRNRIFELFKTQLQQTPHSFVQEKRLQHARALLESSHAGLKEIAGACGFEYMEVFHRNFSKRFGVTPKQYRNNLSPYQD